MSPRLPARLLAAQSDRRLVELIGAGHERAFEVLVQRYRRPLLAYCARMGLSEALAEDVLQHALLQAWIALGRGTVVREPRPWLYRIVHNTAVNALRGAREDQRPLIEALALGAPLSGAHDPERRLAVRQTLSDVAALPQMQRDAILLSAVDGRSHEEVASALGVSDGAVRGLLYRARVTLRGAAAALTPGPLVGWAAGAAGRMAPSAARLAEIAGPGSDTGALLMKGVAVAATAVLAAGAVLVPLRGHRAHSHGHHATAAATLHGASTDTLAAGVLSAQSKPAVGSAPSAASGSHRGSGAAHGRSPASGGRRLVSTSPVSSAPGGPTPGRSHVQPIVTAGPTPGTLGTGTGTGAGAGATASSSSGQGTGASGSGTTTGPAPGTGQPPAAGGSSPPEGGGKPAGGEGDEAELARERAEHEAEVAREARERQEEAAREQHEREEEAARERREQEKEAAGERTGDK